MTKCDENHSKHLDILQYEIILGTYFTIYLYISVRLFPLCKMNELQHDNKQKDLCTQWILRLAWAIRMKKMWVLTATHWAHSEDCQTGWMPRLIWVFAGRTHHFAGFVMRRLKWSHWIPVGRKISSFANRDKLLPIILNYALLKRLTCQDVFTVANYLC